jgi:hypothetical protein
VAKRWIKGKSILAEFSDKNEAKQGDILMFSGSQRAVLFGPYWPWLIAISVTRDRVAVVQEIENCHGKMEFKLLLTRIYAIENDGLIFRGGLHIG